MPELVDYRYQKWHGDCLYDIISRYIGCIVYFFASNTSHMVHVNKFALACDPHNNDNENITQKAKLPLVSGSKMYFPEGC